MSLKIEREAQKSQQPSVRVGDNQSERVGTGEGSKLGSPVKAGETDKAMPKPSE